MLHFLHIFIKKYICIWHFIQIQNKQMETKQIQSRGLKSLKVKCNEFCIQFIMIYKQSLKPNKSMLTFRKTIFRFYHRIMGDLFVVFRSPNEVCQNFRVGNGPKRWRHKWCLCSKHRENSTCTCFRCLMINKLYLNKFSLNKLYLKNQRAIKLAPIVTS